MTNKLSTGNLLMWRILKEKIEMLDALISETQNSYLTSVDLLEQAESRGVISKDQREEREKRWEKAYNSNMDKLNKEKKRTTVKFNAIDKRI